MKLLSTIIITLVLLFVISFSLSNTELVHLTYYDLIDVSSPSYLLIFVCFGVGVIFAGLFGIVERWRLARKVAKLEKHIGDLKKKISENEEDESPISVVAPLPEDAINEVSDRS